MELEVSDEFFYRIRKKDDDICVKFDTCEENVYRNNPSIKFYPGEWVKVKINDFILHFVKPAETIEDIAARYNMSEEKLIIENNLKDKKLFIGQKIKIMKNRNKKTTIN